jgi:parallel beta-helix repeat protein
VGGWFFLPSAKVEEIQKMGVNSPTLTTTTLPSSYIPHEPILILSDQNFTDYGFPGTGTEEDPYRIEDYFINATEGNHAIGIYHTSKRFIIQNCYLTTNKEGTYPLGGGIYIENTTDSQPIIRNNFCVECDSFGIRLLETHFATLTNNTCVDNGACGLMVHLSADPTVTDNICIRNQGGGVVIVGATDAIIENNICEENELCGIYLGSVHFKTCTRNRCENNKMNGMCFGLCYGTITENYCANNSWSGMSIGGSSYSIFVNNTCRENTNGIYVIESFHLQVLNNTCENNDYGIYLVQGAWYDMLANNTIINSTYDGIYAMRTRELLVVHNQIENSQRYGVYLEGRANDSVIAYNSFINNNPAGLSQGYDDGFRNMWYDKEAKRGNYWKDYEGKGSYKIAGQAEAVDKYPLTEQLERVHTTSPYWALMSLVVLPVIVIPVLLLYLLLYKKRKL